MRIQRAVFECMQTNIANCIAIVSSDSDFTDLTIYMRKNGIYTIGFGEAKTLDILKNSYDEFIELNNNKAKTLSDTHIKSTKQNNKDIANNNTTNTKQNNLDSKKLNILIKAIQNTKSDNTNNYRLVTMFANTLKNMNPSYTKSYFGLGASSSWKKLFDSYPNHFETYKVNSTLKVKLKTN